MEKTFVAVRFNEADSHGDIIAPGSIKNAIGKKLPITHEFGQSVKDLISFADKIDANDQELKITANIPDEYKQMTPAIGFQVIKSESNEHGGRTIHEMKLFCVSLNAAPNVDANIKPLDQQ